MTYLSIFSNWRVWVLVGVLAALLGAFYAGHHYATLEFAQQEKDRVETEIESLRLARLADSRRQERVIAAQNSAQARATAAARDAAATRSELDSVRALSDAALAAASVSHSACLDRADALNFVFKSCAGRYAELGEKADRHANDAKTLTDAWPKP